jgi:hypothetical protein
MIKDWAKHHAIPKILREKQEKYAACGTHDFKLDTAFGDSIKQAKCIKCGLTKRIPRVSREIKQKIYGKADNFRIGYL